MSSELEFRQQLRNRKRKQLVKKKLFMLICSLIIILILVLCVKSFFEQSKTNNVPNPEFIFNGYVYPQPLETNSDVLVRLKNGDEVKTAYLTFDDGPNSSVTPQVLDVLRRYNIKATFFAVGTLIEEYPQIARRIYDEGHLLANHSYSHNYSELYADKESFMSQVEKTHELITKITQKPYYKKVFRFPGGGHNAGSFGEVKQEYKKILDDNGFIYCDWNSLTGDAESVSPSESTIMERLKSSTKGKEDVVVLMHDALSKKITAKTLPDVIEYLMSQGFVFDTLDNI